MLLCCLWEEEESLWNVSCKAYHKKDQRQNSLLLLKIQEILKRDMGMDFTLVCIVLKWFSINIALSMLKNYNEQMYICAYFRVYLLMPKEFKEFHIN